MPNAFDLLVRQPFVIRGDDIHDNRAGTEGGALSTLRCQIPHNARYHHLQSAAGTAGGNVDIYAFITVLRFQDNPIGQQFPSGEFLHFGDGVDNTGGNVFDGCLHGSGCLAADDELICVAALLDQNRFGCGAATVCGKNRLDVPILHRCCVPLKWAAIDIRPCNWRLIP